jgi:site-specific DNA recombinase
MSEKATIYARVSTDIQRDNYSIPTQVDACRKFINNQGWELVGNMFVDAESGKDCQAGNGGIPAFVDDFTSRELSRPGLDAALEYLEMVGFERLVVYSLDRLARDPYIRQTLEHEFAERGARVEFVTGAYEPTAEGEVRKDLDATFARWENFKRVERCNRGKAAKAQKGLFVAGRTPYGYRRDNTSLGGLAVYEPEASVIRRIFHMYVYDGLSVRGIADALNNEGIKPMDGGLWGKTSIKHILENTTYIGRNFYGKYKRLDKKRLLENDHDNWIEIPTLPIVEAGDFVQVQRMLAENADVRRRTPTRFYLLSGMVYCKDCERPYVAQTAKGGRYKRPHDIQSYRHRAKEGHCKNRQITGHLLEERVWDTLLTILLDRETLREGYMASVAQRDAQQARAKGHLETLQRNLQKAEMRRRKVNEMYADPELGLSKTEYLEMKTPLEREIEDIKAQLRATEEELAQWPMPPTLATIETFAERIQKGLQRCDVTPEARRELYETLHLRVLLGLDGSMILRGWFGNSDGLSDSSSS